MGWLLECSVQTKNLPERIALRLSREDFLSLFHPLFIVISDFLDGVDKQGRVISVGHHVLNIG